MFKFMCFFVLICGSRAASIGRLENRTEKHEIIPLLWFEHVNDPNGSFRFGYEGGDQTVRKESAQVVNAGTEDEALEVSGSYRYIDQEGHTVEVSYTAGKNGFVPVGTNILSEISAAAKAAADLPKLNEENLKLQHRYNKNEENLKLQHRYNKNEEVKNHVDNNNNNQIEENKAQEAANPEYIKILKTLG